MDKTVNDMDWDAAKESMKRWYWWGVSTFFRAPLDDVPGHCDIGLMGIPHSSGNGSTERDQHLGPRSVRNLSAQYRRTHGRFGFSPWEVCKIADVGDVPLPQAMVNDISVGHIESYAARFNSAGTRLISMGGDHSITGPLIKALYSTQKLTSGEKIALIHFDAHTDSYGHLPHWLGNEKSAAHWADYIVKEGCIDSTKSTQIGIRPNVGTPGSRKASEAVGYRIIDMDEFEESGWLAVAQTARERVGSNPLYITFDLDALDPVDAPGVSNLEPGYAGIRVAEAIRILQSFRGLNIVGADIACLMPVKDNPSQITSMNAMVIMFELLCLAASRHVKSGE